MCIFWIWKNCGRANGAKACCCPICRDWHIAAKPDRDWTMLFISQGCYELTGYKPESLLNNAVLSYNDLIHPEDREMLWLVLAKKRRATIRYFGWNTG